MIHEDFQIVRLDESVLGRPFEEIIRVLHDNWSSGAEGSYQDSARASAASPGAARPLPSGCDRAGIAGHDRGIERTDIDAKLQRVG